MNPQIDVLTFIGFLDKVNAEHGTQYDAFQNLRTNEIVVHDSKQVGKTHQCGTASLQTNKWRTRLTAEEYLIIRKGIDSLASLNVIDNTAEFTPPDDMDISVFAKLVTQKKAYYANGTFSIKTQRHKNCVKVTLDKYVY
jgi:hypothetical protein